jgi:Ca2+-binding RTX toxin-like protein
LGSSPVTSNTGTIEIYGTGGSIGINAGGSDIKAQGNIKLTGNSKSSDGVNLGGSAVTSNTGTIEINGTGENRGINAGGSPIKAEGNIKLTGNSGLSDGVNLGGSPVTSNTGTIEINGTGGNLGINVGGSDIKAEGNIKLIGNGKSSNGVNLGGSTVTSKAVTIDIYGTGNQNGIFAGSSDIKAQGEIKLSGIANSGNGVFIDGGSIESQNGTILIKGNTGNSSSGFGINFSANTSVTSMAGEINLLGNTISLGNSTQISTTNNVYINSDSDGKSGVTRLGATVGIIADTLFLNDTVQFDYDDTLSAFNRIEVTGKVDLKGSTLQLDLTNAPSTPDVYTLIDNDDTDGIISTFDGLAEGDVVEVNGNLAFLITYKGDSENPSVGNIGTGNDVQLYTVTIPATPIITNGTGQPDTITGGVGKNIISSGGGNDSLLGGFFDDTLGGGSGNDTLLGNNGNDLVDGGSGSDTLLGGNGNDTILAGGGNDTLVGGMGNDTLTGGSGNDFFRFNSPNEGIDKITDFNTINDSIALQSTGFSLPVGILSSSQFVIGSSATTSAQRIIYDSNTGNLFFDDDGNGANSAVQIAQLNSRLSLTNQDFIVI